MNPAIEEVEIRGRDIPWLQVSPVPQGNRQENGKQSLRETSQAELELFSWMCVEGWSPCVHVPTGDIEVGFILIAPYGDEFHDDRKDQDKARDAFLIARGLTVLRLSAREVSETPAIVIHRIRVKFDAN